MAKYETISGGVISCNDKVAEKLKKKPDTCPDKIVGRIETKPVKVKEKVKDNK